jgi:hypothetical protein
MLLQIGLVYIKCKCITARVMGTGVPKIPLQVMKFFNDLKFGVLCAVRVWKAIEIMFFKEAICRRN